MTKRGKKFTAMAMAVMMMFSGIGAVTSVYGNPSYLPGEGTAAEPFLISTPGELERFALTRNGNRRYYVMLLNDIIMTRQQIPLFNGNFDGRGHTIYTNGNPVFQTIGSRGVVTNLHVVGNLPSSRGVFGGGGLANTNAGVIINSSSAVDITPNEERNIDLSEGSFSGLGGLVGINTGTIVNSSASGDVVGRSDIGGLVGVNRGTIINSFASGDVSGTWNIGSLVGYNNAGVWPGDAAIHQSYAFGTVEWWGIERDIRFIEGQWDLVAERRLADGIGGMVGREGPDSVISDEPLNWLWHGRQPRESRVWTRPELTDAQRESLERIDAMLTIMQYTQGLCLTITDLSGAFGEGPLTDIQREEIEWALESRATILRLYEERAANPIPQAPIRRPSNNNQGGWIYSDYAAWGLTPGDPVPSWDWDFIETYQSQSQQSRNQSGTGGGPETFREAGRGIIGFALDFHPLTPEFVVEAGIDFALDATMGVANQSGLAEQGRVNMNFLHFLGN